MKAKSRLFKSIVVVLLTCSTAFCESKNPAPFTANQNKAPLSNGIGGYFGLSRDVQSEYSKFPPGLQHMALEAFRNNKSRGLRLRPLFSFSSDPSQTKLEQVWLGPAFLYDF